MAKKKIKKFLKKVAPLALAGLGAAMLGNKRRKDSISANEAKEFGFGQMRLKDYGPFSIGTKRSQMPRIKPKMMTPQDMANDPMFLNAETLMNDTRMFKKGGRVGCGVAKRGFGKAMKKGGKK